MNNTGKLLLFLAPTLLLAFWSGPRLRQSPLEVDVLKGADTDVDAFRIKLFLDRGENEVTVIPLSQDQKKQGADILKRREEGPLSEFFKTLGGGRWVIGDPTAEEGWPEFLGGGWPSLWRMGARESFDNLQWTDRIYLAFRTQTPPLEPMTAPETPAAGLPAAPGPSLNPNPSAAAASAVPVRAGDLRVEILNGCGIKGAADWAARRLKGPGLVIIDTGNADNFRYAESVVKTSAGIPISLEDAVERLGLTKESIVESENPATTDVVVIIGRDYRKLKERLRGRNQH